jgi:hypothetical protein
VWAELTSGFTISRDFVAQKTPASWKVTMGKTVGKQYAQHVVVAMKVSPDRVSRGN